MKYVTIFKDEDIEYGKREFDTLEKAQSHIKEFFGITEVATELNVWHKCTITDYDFYGAKSEEIEHYRISTI